MQEFWFVTCTGVTLFALVLHFLHRCYSLTALLSANQNWVIFSCMLLLNIIISSSNNGAQTNRACSRLLHIFKDTTHEVEPKEISDIFKHLWQPLDLKFSLHCCLECVLCGRQTREIALSLLYQSSIECWETILQFNGPDHGLYLLCMICSQRSYQFLNVALVDVHSITNLVPRPSPLSR